MVNKKLPNDSEYGRDFIDADFFAVEVTLRYLLNGLHPQTLPFFLTIMLVLRKN